MYLLQSLASQYSLVISVVTVRVRVEVDVVDVATGVFVVDVVS